MRIADIPMELVCSSASLQAVFTPFGVGEDTPADLRITVTPPMLDAEAAHLPRADAAQCCAVAVLRELCRQLPAHDRLYLHAATVVYRQKAYTFVAPSGTGKTTHIMLWKQHFGEKVTILNDDKTILHVGKNEVTVYAHPWRNSLCANDSGAYPLAGLFVLERADVAACAALDAVHALPALWRATPCPASQQDTVLSLLERLTAAVPLYRLQAPMTTDAVIAAASCIGGFL